MTRVDLHLSCMDTYTWAVLKLRSGWIPWGTTSILMSFRIAVGDKATTGKYHAWCSLTAAGRLTLKPRNIPYDLQDLIQEQTGAEVIILTTLLRNNWLGATTYSGSFAITVPDHATWKKLQRQTLLHITHITGKGQVIRSVATRGNTETEVELGQFPLDIVNLPQSVRKGTVLSFLKSRGIPTQGCGRRSHRMGCTLTVRLDNEKLRIQAGKLLSNQLIPCLSETTPIRISVVWAVPKGACFRCFHPTNPDGYSFHRQQRGQAYTCANKGAVCLACKSIHTTQDQEMRIRA
jgi:hypothetical protein